MQTPAAGKYWKPFNFCKQFEPCHEMMVLFVFGKLILQMRMRSYPVGLDVWFLVGLFVYFHTSCVRTAKALARLHKCAGSPKPSLVDYVISTCTIIPWAGSFIFATFPKKNFSQINQCHKWFLKIFHKETACYLQRAKDLKAPKI